MGERKAKNYDELEKKQTEKRKEKEKSKSAKRAERYQKAHVKEGIGDRQLLHEAEEREGVRKEKEAVQKAVRKAEGKKQVKKPVKHKISRSKKYQTVRAQVDRGKFYPIDEALEILPKLSISKFEGSCEAHIRFQTNIAKDQETSLRGMVKLPHSVGKKLNVVVIDDEIISKIEAGWTDFDVALATPEMMPKIAKLAKILGPRGRMPNPKSQTVTADPEKRKAELEAGDQVEYRADSQNIIHINLGKLSWSKEKLKENYQAVMSVLPINRIVSVHLAPTIGPSIRVKI